MTIDADSLRQQIPYYLTAAPSQKVLLDELGKLIAGSDKGYFIPAGYDGSVERFRMILDAPEVARPEPDEWVCDGARCRVTGGPFAGFEGFLKPFHRHASGRVKMRKGPNVMVVLPVAGQEIEIQMPIAFLAEI